MKELSHDGPSPGLMRQVTGEVMSTFTSDTEHIIKISELKKSFYVFHNATPSLSSYIKYVRSKKKKKFLRAPICSVDCVADVAFI